MSRAHVAVAAMKSSMKSFVASDGRAARACTARDEATRRRRGPHPVRHGVEPERRSLQKLSRCARASGRRPSARGSCGPSSRRRYHAGRNRVNAPAGCLGHGGPVARPARDAGRWRRRRRTGARSARREPARSRSGSERTTSPWGTPAVRRPRSSRRRAPSPRAPAPPGPPAGSAAHGGPRRGFCAVRGHVQEAAPAARATTVNDPGHVCPAGRAGAPAPATRPARPRRRPRSHRRRPRFRVVRHRRHRARRRRPRPRGRPCCSASPPGRRRRRA